METLLKLLDDLIRPGNWPFLVAFIVVLIGLATFTGLLIAASIRQKDFDRAFRIRSLWIHLYGGPEDPRTPARAYRKLLYVKVNFLAKKELATAPFYQGVVSRLDAPDQIIPVYDEAVYYTLKLLPETRKGVHEQDKSSNGVIDGRRCIPWATNVDVSGDVGQYSKDVLDFESEEETDTMLTVSHILNGLQGHNQKFETSADEDAELRLVVDFSSIPNAADVVSKIGTCVRVDNQAIRPDSLHDEDCGGSVYMAFYPNAKRGSVLEMSFAFRNWNATSA